jgi:polar amino acid transport system substrate-binding protein
MRPRTFRLLALLGLLSLAALLTFAACGDGDDGEAPEARATTAGETPDGETPTAIDISNVPELADGTLTIGSDIAYAPMEFFEEGTETPAGLDVDLANAIGDLLGVEVEFVNSGFDGLIPALNTDEFDSVMSAMTITEERSQQVSFVPYLNVGTGILVPAGNPDDIQSEQDLCGLTVAVQLGTIQEELVRGLSDSCDEPIDVVTHDTNPLAVEDLRTGGADANLADFPVAALDAEESDGSLEVIETQIDPEPYGIAVRMDATELMDVLEQALAALRESGEYDRILAEWGLEAAALS